MAISPAMIEAVLFDLDNLMVDSEPLHLEASRRLFAKYGKDVNTLPESITSNFYGMRVIDAIEIMVDFFGLGGSVDIGELNREQEIIFLDFVREGLMPMTGLYDVVKMVEKLGLKRAVASSGTRVYVNLVIEQLGLKSFFDAVVTGDMVEKGKPAPDIFLKAAEVLGAAPPACIVLEDATNGVRAAKAAGMKCIAVANTVGGCVQDLSMADIIVDSLKAIDEKMFRSFIN